MARLGRRCGADTLAPAVAKPLVARVARNAGRVISGVARAAGLPGRGVWSRPGRYHIEVRGVAEVDGQRLARRVERLLGQLPGVAWARVNAASGRVVVAVHPPEPKVDDLIALVAAAERDGSCDPDPDMQPHPPEEGPRTGRAVSTIAADAVGLAFSAFTRILPYTPLPAEVGNFANVIDLHPRLHALTGRALRSRQRADSVLPMVEALAQGLAGGWAGPVVDGAQRLLQWTEARAQLAAWEAAEEQLFGTPERAASDPVIVQRPRPKPSGPAERYAARILTAGGVAGGLALPVAGFKRAAALTFSTMPKAPRAGREVYATQLGRLLARRGVIAMDRCILRELDRIDTLLLDEAVLRSGRAVLTDLVPLAGVDAEEVATRAFALFDPDEPAGVRSGDGWSLGPVDQLAVRGRTGAREAGRLGADGATVLGLAAGGRLSAVVRVDPEPAPGLDALVAAARRAGLRVVIASEAGQRDKAGQRDESGQPLSRSQENGPPRRDKAPHENGPPHEDGQWHGFADAVLPGGGRLTASVRRLQLEGAVVMLLSRDQRALAMSDCGLGMCHPDALPPWGAHLLVHDLDVTALVVGATGTARTVVEQGIVLSGAGTALGSLSAFTSPRQRLPASSVAAVNAAASVSMLNGLWHGRHLPAGAAVPPAPAVPWHLMPAGTVLARLGSRPDGLGADEVARRGSRAAEDTTAGMGLARAFAEELANPLTPILGAGAALSAAVGSPADAGLVGGVIAVSALVGAVQRVNTERSLAELLSRSAVDARVRRDGAEQTITATDLVPGDIVLVAPGDVIPADCRILEADGLEADESSLTGESLPVAKSQKAVVAAAIADRTSMLYEGTTVAAGRGTAVVVATGPDTEVGRGMAMARQTPPATGVEARLGRLTRLAVPLAAGSAAAVVGTGLLRGVPLAETAAAAANLAVASVPEGLPFLVSAAQLAAARRLADHGALVRNPRTIEALGRVDVLCFDKTGTLTEGALALAGLGDGDRYLPLNAVDTALQRVLAAALRATPPPDQQETAGQTDHAVVAGARHARVDVDTGARGWRGVAALPFEPSRGYHATVGGSRGDFLLSVKGAPETILPRCVRRRTAHGDRPLDEGGRVALQQRLEQHAGAGHRILAVAERPVPTDTIGEADVGDLTFLGFLTLADAVRESAAPAVRRIRSAGVHTIMVTGDHPATAEAIAATISPDDTRQRVVTGTEIDQLDDDALAELLTRTDVVARCTPTHKVRIIQTLQARGRTVAMTGDGANDAPAIRLADVGMALGRRGTPAARAAADLVVTDDRLETIIAAMVEGRAMWSSVRHALSILVGGNLGEIMFSVLTAAVTGRSALNGRQLLLVNLLTDLAPAMSIAVRPPGARDEDLLGEGPDTSLGGVLTREIALRAASTTLGATSAWTVARFTGRQRRASTISLAALVGTQLGQTVWTGGRNPTTVAASLASAAVLAAIIQTPGLSQFFGCTPLGPVGWGIASGSALGATLANPVLKRFLPDAPGADAGPATGDSPETGDGPEAEGNPETGDGPETDAGSETDAGRAGPHTPAG